MIATREGFGKEIVALGKENPDILVVDIDIGKSCKTGEFRKELPVPLLVGVSRKSMIYKYLGGTPADSLNGTTVLNTIALLNGTDILRVHDVKAAVEAVKLVSKTFNFQLSTFNC